MEFRVSRIDYPLSTVVLKLKHFQTIIDYSLSTMTEGFFVLYSGSILHHIHAQYIWELHIPWGWQMIADKNTKYYPYDLVNLSLLSIQLETESLFPVTKRSSLIPIYCIRVNEISNLLRLLPMETFKATMTTRVLCIRSTVLGKSKRFHRCSQSHPGDDSSTFEHEWYYQ